MGRLDGFRYRLFILVCIAAALACHGCGGGGGGAAVSGAAFAPNYVYHLRGLSHWPRFPVRVYFDRGSQAYTPERAALAASGFDQWAAATGGQASFTIVDD